MVLNPPNGQKQEPEWQQFLQLGEMLLKQPDAAAQCGLIIKAIQARIPRGQAQVWLVSPFYPLPGEALPIQLASESDSPLVEQAVQSREPAFHPNSNGAAAAVPLISQDALLGVMEIQLPAGSSFSAEDTDYLQRLAANAAASMQINRQVSLKKWRYEQLALVRSVSNQIANVMDLDELCSRVTHLICQSFKYYLVAIFTIENESKELRFRGSTSTNLNQLIRCNPVEIGKGIVGHVALTSRELVAPDIRKETHYQFISCLPETKSEAAFPLLVENRIVGVLDVQSDRYNAFHEIDMMVLRALADNIALAVEGARLYTDLQDNLEKISAASEIGRAISSVLELEQLPDEVMQLIHEKFGYPFVHLFSVHSGRRMVFYMTGSGARSEEMRSREIAYDLDAPLGIIPWVARTGKTVFSNNVLENEHYRPTELLPAETLSEMTIPLTDANDVIGVLDIQSDKLNAFKESDLPIFESLAASLAIALRNATLFKSERWRRQVSESLRDVAGLLSDNVAIDQLLETILKELERNLPCGISAMWLLPEEDSANGKTPQLRLAACRGGDAEQVAAVYHQSEPAAAYLCSALRKPTPTIRKPEDPHGPLGTAMHYPPEYSSIAAPLHIGNQPIGILTLAHPTYGRYGSEAASMTATFASYTAVAIQNARFYSEAQQQAYISTVLLQVAEAYQNADSIDSLLTTTVRITPLLVGVKKCAAFLWEDYRGGYELKAWYGLKEPPANTLYKEDDLPALARLRETLTPVFIEDPVRELQLTSSDPSNVPHTLVLLPLVVRGKLLGALMVEHSPTGQTGAVQKFTEQTLTILEGISDQTALSLENLQLIEKRQEESYVTAVMLQVTQTVASQNKLEDILDTIVHLMPILIGIDTCLIYLWHPESKTFLTVNASVDESENLEEILQQSYTQGEFPLLDTVLENNQPVFCLLPGHETAVSEWKNLPCLAGINAHTLTQLPNLDLLIGFPLSIKGENYGVLLARDSGQSPAFREKRIEIISGIAQQISIAIQNEKFNQETVERERMKREFELARQIQQAFLPSHLPEVRHWELDARWETARTVGGDFYDIFKLDRHRLGLVIADVSDKGMAAALYMTVTRTLIRANVRNYNTPGEVLEQVNQQLQVNSENGMFVTAVYAILNLESGQLTYANAGHNLPLLLRESSGTIEVLPKGGIALGIVTENPIENHQLKLFPGDSLLLYTDGITECFAPSGEAFGEARLHQIMAASRGKTIHAFFESLQNALADFRETLPPSDDITFLAVRRGPQDS